MIYEVIERDEAKGIVSRLSLYGFQRYFHLNRFSFAQ